VFVSREEACPDKTGFGNAGNDFAFQCFRKAYRNIAKRSGPGKVLIDLKSLAKGTYIFKLQIRPEA
jgi:hypothetical protein